MTNEEIVQALRCRARHEKATNEGCKKCPYWATENLKEWQKLCGWASCEVYQIISDAADAIERLTAENAALREKVPQWISVEERLPIDRLKKYLVAFRDTFGPIVDMANYFPNDGWTCDNWDVPQKLITHWMQLPDAPEEGGKA